MTPDQRDEMLVRIDEKVADMHGRLPPLEARVDSLESTRDRAKGILAVVAVVWSGLIASAEYLFHHNLKR